MFIRFLIIVMVFGLIKVQKRDMRKLKKKTDEIADTIIFTFH